VDATGETGEVASWTTIVHLARPLRDHEERTIRERIARLISVVPDPASVSFEVIASRPAHARRQAEKAVREALGLTPGEVARAAVLWEMSVWLTLPLYGEERDRARRAMPGPLREVATTNPERHGFLVEVEASSLSEAARAAEALVAAAVPAGLVDHAEHANADVHDRQVLLWVVGTRRQLRRWELVLARCVRAWDASAQPDPSDIWLGQVERHLALIATNNLLRAIEDARGRFKGFPPQLERDVRNLRDLQEHWDEQWPSFYDPRNPERLHRGGAEFVGRHPGAGSPFNFLRLDGVAGPELGPGTARVADMFLELDRLQRDVLKLAPWMSQFVTPVDPSPWLPSTWEPRPDT
jgi:hypothetical protein